MSDGDVETLFCDGPTATAVDEFIHHHAFVGWKSASPRQGGKQSVPPALKNPKAWVEYLVDTEFRAAHHEAIAQQALAKRGLAVQHGAEPARTLKAAAKELSDLQRRYIEDRRADGSSYASALAATNIPQLVSAIYRQKHDFLVPGYENEEKRFTGTREAIAAQPFPLSVDCLGFLFLERVRIRSLGHTVDRAPFYTLTLPANHSTTLRQRTFTKRVNTIEDTREEAEEQKREDSATFSTEFTKELERSVERTTSWGVKQSMSAGVNVGIVELKGQTDGTYNANDSVRQASHELSKVLKNVARKVESSQKATHKIVMSVATENTFEQESTRTFKNDDVVAKKLHCRKVLQALQVTHERYGIRACWVASIRDPSKELRELVMTKEKYPAEWALAQETWADAPIPSDVATLPGNIVNEIYGPYSGGLFGDSGDEALVFTVPAGYELDHISTGTFGDGWSRVHDGVWRCPDGEIYPYPGEGATGDITFFVHWGVPSSGVGCYIARVVCRPEASIREDYDARVAAWRQQQTEREFLKLLAPRYEEIIASVPETWPPMVTMRRLAKDYFGLPDSFSEVDFIQRIFDWENLGVIYEPPAYDPVAEPNLLQCIPTNPFNASWAKALVPLRPGHEEEAIAFLMSAGIIPSDITYRNHVEYYLHQMRSVFEPLYERAYAPDDSDRDEILGAEEIQLTSIGEDVWDNSFEEEAKFEVLDRYVATIPTDGVDIEEGPVFCDHQSELAKAIVAQKVEQVEMSKAIRAQVDGGATVSVNVASTV